MKRAFGNASVQPRVGLFGALAFACGIAVLAGWALTRPAHTARPLSVAEPRPDLLDRPHRHLAAARPSP